MTASASTLLSARRSVLETCLASPRLADAARAEAHYALWELCQSAADPAAASKNLAAAMRLRPLRTRPSTDGAVPERAVLVLAAPGDFQANLPLDLLFDGRTLLHTLRIADPDAALRDPASVFGGHPPPPFDCTFVAIAEGEARLPHLFAADRVAAHLGLPVVNNGAAIARLSRPGAARLLADLDGVFAPCPVSVHASRREPPLAFPFLLRPAASHAGRALVLIGSEAEFRHALSAVVEEADASLLATPFVDYRSADGLFRKYRVAFVGGRPLPVHLAIHDEWAIWYYNAGMDRFPTRRREEDAFLADLDAALPALAREALAAIGARLGLDYAGLDFGVLPDGRLLVFEVETGMVVHDRDPPDLFAGKVAAARRIAAALGRLIDGRVASTGRS